MRIKLDWKYLDFGLYSFPGYMGGVMLRQDRGSLSVVTE